MKHWSIRAPEGAISNLRHPYKLTNQILKRAPNEPPAFDYGYVPRFHNNTVSAVKRQYPFMFAPQSTGDRALDICPGLPGAAS